MSSSSSEESVLGNVLYELLRVVELDQRISSVVAHRKRQLAAIQECVGRFEAAKIALENARAASEIVRQRYDQEEKALKEEREKLKARRKALATFAARVQQSALQELERSERILSAREESIFAIVDSLDEVEDAEKKAQAEYTKCEAEVKSAKDASREEGSSLENQFKEARKLRDEALQRIPAAQRKIYEQAYERFPANSVVLVKKNHCSGCYMTVPPQIRVELFDKSKLVRCRGCSRILVLDLDKENEE